MKKTKYIWMNGEYLPWENANIHVLSHGLHYGTGFFEGIRSYKIDEKKSAVFRLDDHIERFYASAKILDFKLEYPPEIIKQTILDLLARNQISAAYIRPLAFLGGETLGLYPHENTLQVIIATWEWGNYLGALALNQGIRTKISSFHRYPPHTAMSHGKITGQYTLSVLAKIEAKRDGYDEAILLDVDGLVAEGSAENIFILEKGKLITPPKLAILPGITRDSMITLAKDMGLSVSEEAFTRDRLYLADEVFLTGTAAEVTPVISVDHRQIGSGRRGPITEKLQAAFFEAVQGKTPAYASWLSFYSPKPAQELLNA